MSMPPVASPSQVANLAQSMARNAEGAEARMFQRIAMISMGVMAIASMSQVAMELFRKAPNKDRDEANRHQRS